MIGAGLSGWYLGGEAKGAVPVKQTHYSIHLLAGEPQARPASEDKRAWELFRSRVMLVFEGSIKCTWVWAGCAECVLPALSFRLCWLRRGGTWCLCSCPAWRWCSRQPLVCGSLCGCAGVLCVSELGVHTQHHHCWTCKGERSSCICWPGMEVCGFLGWTPEASGKSVLYK